MLSCSSAIRFSVNTSGRPDLDNGTHIVPYHQYPGFKRRVVCTQRRRSVLEKDLHLSQSS